MGTAPRAILFDLDGTLLDTAPDMVAALNELRAQERLPSLPYAAVRPLVSHGAARLIKLGFPAHEPAQVALLQARFLQIYHAAVSVQTRLFDGMDAVLRELERRRLVCGIVTNKPAWLTDPLLAQLHLTQRFVCVVSGDSVSERKPHPMPLLHAAKLAGVEAQQCIYLGDAERDIAAAHAAGMAAVVATYGYLDPGEWQTWGAEGWIDEPLDLLGWLDRHALP